jgi:hypothetical protein
MVIIDYGNLDTNSYINEARVAVIFRRTTRIKWAQNSQSIFDIGRKHIKSVTIRRYDLSYNLGSLYFLLYIMRLTSL